MHTRSQASRDRRRHGSSPRALDSAPHRYIAAIITERGMARDPYIQSLKELFH